MPKCKTVRSAAQATRGANGLTKKPKIGGRRSDGLRTDDTEVRKFDFVIIKTKVSIFFFSLLTQRPLVKC